jgi:hypothetical protein
MADTPPNLKAVVISNRFYTVFFEQYQNLTFIHIDVSVSYTATVKQLMLQDLKVLMALRDSPLFALHDPDDLKHKKFLKLMGFSYLQNVPMTSGSVREVFIKDSEV